MSPALLNKYLLAARNVADHMFLNAHGFDFAPHPMLVETDRDRYCIQEIVDFYGRQNTDYADYFRAAWLYKHRAVFGKPNATLADVAAQMTVSAKYLTTIWKTLETKEEIGPLAKLQSMWRSLPVPKSDQRDLAGDGAARMRDFVVRMRKDTSLVFSSPTVKGLSVRTQPLMNWKLRAYATHRRDFDRAALRDEGEAPPVEPTIPLGRDGKPVGYGLVGLGPNGEDLTALKAQVRAYASRMENADLVVPAGQRARYEEAFATFSSVFPDAFYVRERGRFYPDESEDKGRWLSAGFHNVMGYTRDDAPLSELILDEKGQKELEALWNQFEFVADYTARTVRAVLLQPERRGSRQRRRVGHPAPVRQGHHRRTRRPESQELLPLEGGSRRPEQSHRHAGDHRSLRPRERHASLDRRRTDRRGAPASRRTADVCVARVSTAARAGRAR